MSLVGSDSELMSAEIWAARHCMDSWSVFCDLLGARRLAKTKALH